MKAMCPQKAVTQAPCLLLLVCALAAFVTPALASDYGTVGLIDIPTARFDRDGVFSVSASSDKRHKQYSISYQATPWLQGTFRYTGFDDYFFWDRNYELKARLWSESYYLPQVAVGVRDVVGSGHFGAEYIAASKLVGRSDITVGLGWGRLSGEGVVPNPLRLVSDRFETRSAQVGLGGRFSVGNFFSGKEVGLFAGLSHGFGSLPLTAMLEYNPDRYELDYRQGGVPRPKSPFSIGLVWHALPGVDLRFSVQHADEVGIGIRTYLDSKEELPRRDPEKFISSYFLSPKDLPSQINKKSWYDRLLYDVERSGLLLLEGTISRDGSQAQLVVGNLSYGLWSDAIGRHTGLADLHLPVSVKSIHFIVEEGGHRSATIVVPRPSTIIDDNGSALRRVRILSGKTLKNPMHRTSFVTGIVNTEVQLKSRFQLFDPDDPARYQVFADVSSEFALSNHWAIRSSIAINVDHNFDESNRPESDSELPKVRSDIVRYLNSGESGLESLIIEGRDTIGRAMHYRVFAGYLEQMYAGAGAEALYWPNRSRLALGLTLANVRQRNFDRGFDFLDYKVLTGHVSAYWASPFYGYDAAVHVGRYLAKDVGATFEIRRTFRNGWQVGLWASLTDVPFDQFGEGSFDKGLFFQMPIDGLFGSRTRSRFSTSMRPIQRDGGQRLDGFSGNIFWDLRTARYDAFAIDGRLLP